MAEKLVRMVEDPNKIHKDDRSKLSALTLNNLGCYYKRIQKPNVALRYMSQALMEEERSRQPKSHIASTKLNICAILSSLSKHKEAIKYAVSAVADLIIVLKLIRINMIPDLVKKRRIMERQDITQAMLDQIDHSSKENKEALNQTLGVA